MTQAMADEPVECYNCGHQNPAWAQVCRNCGTPMRAATRQPEGPVPTDQDSLVSMLAGVGAIVLAIVLGLFLSGLIPDAPVAATPSPTPEATASRTPRPTRTPAASVEESLEPTPEPTPELLGTVTFGTGRNSSTLEITGVTSDFGPGVPFCHSITMSENFGVSQIQEEIIRIEGDGSLVVVQPRQGSNLGVRSDRSFASYCVSSTNPLISAWGTGTFILRDYRGGNASPELIAEARFTFAN